MKIKKITSIREWIVVVLIALCVFQSPLEEFWGGFKIIDEAIVFFTLLIAVRIVYKKSFSRKVLKYATPFMIFVIACFVGNVLFGYQPWRAVLIDAFTNIKFWLVLYSFYVFSKELEANKIEKIMLLLTKIVSILLFVCFILERFGILFSGGQVATKWNIPSSLLFYSHPTYFAGALVVLLAILMIRWKRSLFPFAIMDLVMLVCTLRSKAYGAALAWICLVIFVFWWRQRIKLWQVFIVAMVGMMFAWEKIYFYYIKLVNQGARSVLTNTSIEILKDYFPFGTGFATFGSHQAAINYSPVYYIYGLDTHSELGIQRKAFLDDTFWPIIIAQSGFIGLCAYVIVIALLIRKAWKLYSIHKNYYVAALFCLAYLLISSTSEPAFNNAIAIPLAIILAYVYAQADNLKRKEENKWQIKN